jgi:hypothetical protein
MTRTERANRAPGVDCEVGPWNSLGNSKRVLGAFLYAWLYPADLPIGPQ